MAPTPPVPPQTLIMNAMLQAAMLDRQHQQQMQQQQVGPTLSMAPAPPMVRPGFVPMTGMAPAAPPSLNGPQPGAPPMSISQMQANAPTPPQPIQNDFQRMLDLNFASTGQPFGRTQSTEDARQQERDAATITDPSQVTAEFVAAQPPAIQQLIQQWQQDRGPFAQAVAAGNTDAQDLLTQIDQRAMSDINEQISSSIDIPKEQRSSFGQESDPSGIVGNVVDFMTPELTMIGALDVPRQISVGRAGEDAYKVASGQQQSDVGRFLTWFPGKTDFQDWSQDPKNAPFIKNAYENGYTGSNGQEFTGGKAVWELFINNEPRWRRGLFDLLYDPATYAAAPEEILKGAATGTEAVTAGTRAAGLGKGVARAFETAATVANVPNLVLNEAADHLVSGALGKFGGLVRKAPGIGKLAETAPATIGEDAAKRRMESIIMSDAARSEPAGVVPTTNIGGIPEPQPGTVTHALAAGDIPQPGTPPVNELAPNPFPVEVTPEGEALPTDPNYFAQGAEPPPTPTSSLATTSPSGSGTQGQADLFTYPAKLPNGDRVIYVGRTGDDTPVRIHERNVNGQQVIDVEIAQSMTADGRVDWRVSDLPTIQGAIDGSNPADFMQGARSVLNEVDTRRKVGRVVPPTVRAQDDLARRFADAGIEQTPTYPDAIETTPAQLAPSVDTAPPPTGPTPITPEDRAAGLQSGTVRANAPVEGGTRLIDRAAQLGQQPEYADAYAKFLAQDVPTPEQAAARHAIEQLPYERTTPPVEKAQKRLFQVLDGVESVADTTGPAFKDNFPNEPLDIPVTETRKSALTTSGKASFKDENDRYLLQRYVYQDDVKALSALSARYKSAPWIDELVSRAEIARQKIQALKGTSPEQIGIIDDRIRRILGLNPQTAPRPLTQPNPNVHIDPSLQAVLDEPITHPDFPGHTVETLTDALTTEATADQAEVQQLIKTGVKPVEPPRGRAKSGVQRGTATIKTPSGASRKVPVNTPSNPGHRLAKLIRKWEPFGNIQTAEPRALATQRLGRISFEEANPRAARRLPLAADIFMALTLRAPRNSMIADPLSSWGYSGRNIGSNSVMAAIGLKGRGINPAKAFNIPEMVAIGRDVEHSVAADILVDTFGEPARGLTKVIAGRATSALDIEDLGLSSAKGVRTPVRDLLAKLYIPEKIAQGFDAKRGLDQIFERGAKLGAAFKPLFRAFLGENVKPLAEELGVLARKRGIPLEENTIYDALWNLRKESGSFSRHDVYDSMYRMATEAGTEDATARTFADYGSRRWEFHARDAYQRAVDDVNRIFPNRRMTNADKYLSYVTLFHMWPTRAAKFVLEESIRDPRLPLWWYRAHEGLNHLADEPGTPASAKGWLKLGQSALGYALFLDPAAAFLVNQLLPDRPDYGDPTGETGFGHVVKWIKGHTGISPTPFIDMMFNVTGLYGSDFLPNPIPSRTKDLAGAVIDAVMTQTGQGMGDPIYLNAMSKLRDWGSGLIPGTSNVPYVDQGDLRNDPIGSMVLEQNPDLHDRLHNPDEKVRADAEAEYGKIMDEENNDPRLSEAEKAVSGMTLITKAFGAFTPFGIRAKNLVRESDIEKAKAAREVPIDQQTPQQQADAFGRSVVTTTPKALGPKAEQDQYTSLGTPQQREIDRNWNLLAFGDIYELHKNMPRGIITGVDGKAIQQGELVRMSQDERIAIANAYIAQNKYDEGFKTINDAQKAFKESHPVYKGYSDFGKTARDYPGGIPAFREQLMRANPAYRQYIGQLPKDTRDNPRELDKRSIDMNAYLAAKGTKASIYAPNLSQDTEGWANTELLLNALGGSNPSTKKAYDLSTPEGKLASLKDKLATYDTDMASYNAAAMKQTGGVPFETLAPQFASVAESQLKNQGIKKPSTPEIVAAYNLWKSYQPDGADTSPEAYIKFLTDYENAGKKAA